MGTYLIAAVVAFAAMFVVEPLFFAFVRLFGIYTIVQERQCKVFVLFGKVVLVLDEPGLHLLWLKLGWKAPLVNWIGRCHVLDLRLDQEYLRSQPVNSEEGAPMGIGIWYEMYISDPVAYLFKNADPRGSLAANVSNATVRCLSNMKLADMLENRHTMSQTVRAEVSPKSQEWGYRLGSVYIRKVHFRDAGMIRQIEEKVVNRLRQVTSSIRQEGANQVSVITSTAERQAAIEFAKARALRPRIVGAALQEIARDPDIARALFEILEIEKLREGKAPLVLIPRERPVLKEASGCSGGRKRDSAPPPTSAVGLRPRAALGRIGCTCSGPPASCLAPVPFLRLPARCRMQAAGAQVAIRLRAAAKGICRMRLLGSPPPCRRPVCGSVFRLRRSSPPLHGRRADSPATSAPRWRAGA